MRRYWLNHSATLLQRVGQPLCQQRLGLLQTARTRVFEQIEQQHIAVMRADGIDHQLGMMPTGSSRGP